MSKTYAIVAAGGRGLRMGGNRPKQFLDLSGRSILSLTLGTLLKARFLSGIVLVVPAEFLDPAKEVLGTLQCGSDRIEAQVDQDASGRKEPNPGGDVSRVSIDGREVRLVAGGAERRDSVWNGLKHLPGDCEWVLIHDGVRPFVSLKLLEDTWVAAAATGASIAAVPAVDTVKRVAGGRVVETLPREEIHLVQTPQVFRKNILMEAYSKAEDHSWTGTDDASFVERLGIAVAVVPGEWSNIKVTTPQDLEWGEWFMKRLSRMAGTDTVGVEK